MELKNGIKMVFTKITAKNELLVRDISKFSFEEFQIVADKEEGIYRKFEIKEFKDK